uniref:Putative secreted protein n=1 Tax=Ixodes scapularis TaxID=6945 RepID=A0A4D5RVE3_IXOSC
MSAHQSFLALSCSSLMSTATCRSRSSFTKSPRLASTSASTPFFGPPKLLLVPLHGNRACFRRLHPRMPPSFSANRRPAALLPMSSATKITFLLKAAEHRFRRFAPTPLPSLTVDTWWLLGHCDFNDDDSCFERHIATKPKPRQSASDRAS